MTGSSATSTSTSTSITRTPTPPFPADSRYEIRRLTTPTDALWAAAITAQSLIFRSPILSKVYTPSATLFDFWLNKQLPLIANRMSPSWSLSLGVFDLEHKYSTEEARKTGGKFDWNTWPDDETKMRELENMTLDEILRRMDFPLVAVALSYDGFLPSNKTAMKEFKTALPEAASLVDALENRDPRDAESRKPTELRQLLRRNATSTKLGYEGKGIAKKLTYFLMDEARRQGFQEMLVDSIHPGVTQIVSNAPAPYSAYVVTALTTDDIKDEYGRRMLGDVKQTICRILVDLKESR